MILTEQSNNMIVVYLLLPWQQLPYFSFFNIFINFFSVFHGLFSLLYVITIIRSMLKIAIIKNKL